jgi:HSP20 family protein
MSEVKVNKSVPAEKKEESLVRPKDFFAPMLPYGKFFALSPIALMREFTNDMERFFSGGVTTPEFKAWAPAVEVKRVNGTLLVTAELPGIKKEEVKIEATDAALIIEGERKSEKKDESEGYEMTERFYGNFYRSIPLPEGVKADMAKAELKDGILKITMPVAEVKAKTRNIPIEEAKSKTAA